MPSQQTIACRKIIESAERSLKAHCVSYPDIMMGCILDAATDLVNEFGYCWDVALAKACEIYPSTKHVGNFAYSK